MYVPLAATYGLRVTLGSESSVFWQYTLVIILVLLAQGREENLTTFLDRLCVWFLVSDLSSFCFPPVFRCSLFLFFLVFSFLTDKNINPTLTHQQGTLLFVSLG